jgi:hypothetical protein
MERKPMGSKLKAALLCAAAGVFILTPAVAAAQENVKVVTVYDATQLPLEHYTVVRRLPLQRPWWQSVPAYRELGAARRALVEEAARIGADGLINLYCVSKADGVLPREGYFCYANAITVRATAPAEVEVTPLR